MSGRSPSKRGRKKKSNKGRKPKKPLSKEEIASKKNQKNMRETCRRVEINLHYELLYHSLGQNLVYNRAERVQLLRKAITKMAELKAQVTSLTDQVRAAGLTPKTPPRFQLNDSQKLFMLVQRWARNDSGKKCSRAKLKPVGIEIIDDNENVPITIPRDGRRISEQLNSDDSDHIPFWASWETNTYMVVDQDSFQKACNQAIIAGWDGKLGSKGCYYQMGLPADCGLTVASSIYSSSTDNSKYSSRPKYVHDDDDDDDDDDDSDNDTQGHDDDTKYIHHIQHRHHRNDHNGHHIPLFPPRIDFPEIVVHNIDAHGIRNNMNHLSSDSRSENNSMTTAEPPIKKQKLNDGRSNDKRKDVHVYNQYNPLQPSLPLSVPFPAVGAMITNPIHPMALNNAPFMHVGISSNNNTPEQGHQSTSSDTNSQHSLSKYIKAEPSHPFPHIARRVQLPPFLTAFHPPPPSHPLPPHQQYNTHNLVPVTAFPMYTHPVMNGLRERRNSNDSTLNIPSTDSKDNIKDDKDHCRATPLPAMSSITTSINLPPLPSNHNDAKNNNICNTVSTVSDEQNTENIHTEQTPPPPSNNNDLSPSGSRTSHETRNSVVFTPANHRKNSSAISTDSTTPDQIHAKSPPPHNKHQGIHLPDNTSFLNHQLNWSGNHSNRESDEYSNYDVLSSHHIGMMNEIPVNGFQDGGTVPNGTDGNGMKGSVFYG